MTGDCAFDWRCGIPCKNTLGDVKFGLSPNAKTKVLH